MNFYNSNVNSRKRVEVVERTAFLEDGLEFVHISEVYSPEHFYVQRAKFRPQLRSLEADMEKKRDKINRTEEEIRVGGVYLADCRDTDDGGIFRVKVQTIRVIRRVLIVCMGHKSFKQYACSLVYFSLHRS